MSIAPYANSPSTDTKSSRAALLSILLPDVRLAGVKALCDAQTRLLE